MSKSNGGAFYPDLKIGVCRPRTYQLPDSLRLVLFEMLHGGETSENEDFTKEDSDGDPFSARRPGKSLSDDYVDVSEKPTLPDGVAKGCGTAPYLRDNSSCPPGWLDYCLTECPKQNGMSPYVFL